MEMRRGRTGQPGVAHRVGQLFGGGVVRCIQASLTGGRGQNFVGCAEIGLAANTVGRARTRGRVNQRDDTETAAKMHSICPSLILRVATQAGP
jgi:hypothetical protein